MFAIYFSTNAALQVDGQVNLSIDNVYQQRLEEDEDNSEGSVFENDRIESEADQTVGGFFDNEIMN
jgi:hypothetical protein